MLISKASTKSKVQGNKKEQRQRTRNERRPGTDGTSRMWQMHGVPKKTSKRMAGKATRRTKNRQYRAIRNTNILRRSNNGDSKTSRNRRVRKRQRNSNNRGKTVPRKLEKQTRQISKTLVDNRTRTQRDEKHTPTRYNLFKGPGKHNENMETRIRVYRPIRERPNNKLLYKIRNQNRSRTQILQTQNTNISGDRQKLHKPLRCAKQQIHRRTRNRRDV